MMTCPVCGQPARSIAVSQVRREGRMVEVGRTYYHAEVNHDVGDPIVPR